VKFLAEIKLLLASYTYMQGLDNIMEILRYLGIEFVCFGYIERTSVGNTECASSVCLHCVVFVSVL
jgi:hypothetical protein